MPACSVDVRTLLTDTAPLELLKDLLAHKAPQHAPLACVDQGPEDFRLLVDALAAEGARVRGVELGSFGGMRGLKVRGWGAGCGTGVGCRGAAREEGRAGRGVARTATAHAAADGQRLNKGHHACAALPQATRHFSKGETVVAIPFPLALSPITLSHRCASSTSTFVLAPLLARACASTPASCPARARPQ